MGFSKTFWYPFITIKLSQTVCYAGEANPSAVGSPTEPDYTEDPDDAPNKLPTSGEETL